jgi:hypothetical protein
LDPAVEDAHPVERQLVLFDGGRHAASIRPTRVQP